MNPLIEIKATPTSNADICEFELSKDVLNKGQYYCKTKEQALGSILLETLFELSGIKEIMVKKNVLMISKNSPQPWREFGPMIGKAIREAFDSPRGFFDANLLEKITPIESNQEKANSKILETELGKKINDLLNELINPSLASHGGHAELIDIKGGDVYLRFGGGCQGCSQITATVKQGVENLLKSNLSEVNQIIDVTDHSLGANPYFK